ncbi:MAG: pyrroline-5-carboxylate reductase [Eubacteriales bacterium]|nr:pyrroline-5-carboxylate reductase [Eubacteriales bacterium]
MRTGFIGCGNMAGAMIRGMIESGKVQPEDVIISARTEATRERARREFGVKTADSNCEVVRASDIIFLAAKPQQYEEIIQEIRDDVKENQIVVSIAPGKTLAWFEEKFGKPVKIVRTSPNTPALVKEGMTAVCAGSAVTEGELKDVMELCESFGRTEIIPEKLMNAVVGVAGSSPAYVFLFIEALADAAVAEGMTRKQAYKFAAQAVMGSAKMVLETGLHPGELKDMVCSPGGTTIEAVQVLEENQMRAAVMKASRACTKKAGDM